MTLLSFVGALVGFGILAGAGINHSRNLKVLASALRWHRLVPDAFHHHVAAAVVIAELVIGVGGTLVVVFSADPSIVRGLAAGAVTLVVLFSVYVVIALAKGVTGPCGCTSTTALDGWLVVRNGLLVLGLAAALLSPQTMRGSEGDLKLTGFAILASIALTVTLWLWPSAMQLARDDAGVEHGH